MITKTALLLIFLVLVQAQIVSRLQTKKTKSSQELGKPKTIGTSQIKLTTTETTITTVEVSKKKQLKTNDDQNGQIQSDKLELSLPQNLDPNGNSFNNYYDYNTENSYNGQVYQQKPYGKFISKKYLPDLEPITQQVAGIILSFHNGHSYDQLFSRVQQQSKQGTVVLTYVADSSSDNLIYHALKGDYSESDKYVRQFVGQVNKLSKKCPGCIVFNWQCSGGYSDATFDQDKGEYIFKLLQLIIKQGYMAMFSDFSLKALINQWNTATLGPNPFHRLQDTNTDIQMKFVKQSLLKSPSSQLQAIGRLSTNNQVRVSVLGGTISYAVNSQREKTNLYTLEVLTIASNFKAPQARYQSYVDRFKGLPCHVLLTYKQGGKILTSMGHWIQLMKIDTTPEKLFEVVETLYGKQQAARVMSSYNNEKSEEGKARYISSQSINIIQNQSPAANFALQGSA